MADGRIEEVDGIRQKNRRLDIQMAEAAAKLVESMNHPRTTEQDDYLRKAYNDNEEVSYLQKRKALIHGISAAAIAALSALGGLQNNIGKICSAAQSASPEIARVFSDIKDSSITLFSHASNASRAAADRITQNISNANQRIYSVVEDMGRLTQKYTI